jgi:PAS domain S-box-containing protein
MGIAGEQGGVKDGAEWGCVEAEPVRTEASPRQYTKTRAFLLALNDRLREMNDAAGMIAVAAELLGRYMRVSRVTYGEVDAREEWSTIWTDWTDGSVPSAVGRYRLADFDAEMLQRYRRGQVRRTNDTHATSTGHASAGDRSLGIRAMVVVPMLKGGHLVAGMGVHSTTARAWTDAEVQLVREVGERIWASLGRARSEQALRAREHRYRALFDSVDEGFCVVELLFDASGNAIDSLHLEANPAYEQHTGMSNVIGKRSNELLPNIQPEWFQLQAEVLRTGQSVHFEKFSPSLNRWCDVHVARVGGPEDNQIAHLFRDITARRQAEEVARRTAERDAFLVSLADALGPLADSLDIQVEATRLLGEHLGADRVHYAEVNGDQALIRRDYTHGDTASVVGTHCLRQYGEAAYGELLAGQAVVYEDIATDERSSEGERAAQRERFGMRARAILPLVKGGLLRGLLSIQFKKAYAWTPAELELIEETAERTWAALERARAEAALRESDERFRRALEIETVGVVFFDADAVITGANAAFCRMLGYDPADIAAGGLRLSDLILPESNQARRVALDLFETTGSTPAYEQHCLRKDGSSVWGLFAAKRLSATERVEFILDITERKRAEDALALAHAELESRVARRTAQLADSNRALEEEVAQRRAAEEVRNDLMRRLDSAQEDERRRVARDLHDQVGQTLTALTLAVHATRAAGALPPAAAARLEDVQRAAEELGREVHELAVRLRPTALDDLGLHAALGQLLSNWTARTRILVDCHISDLQDIRLPPDVETILYRVVQEALTNVARHSHAKHVSVVLQRVNGTVVAVIEDDGVGFDLAVTGAGRLGLRGIQERVSLAGGFLDIESVAGQGATVLARLPLLKAAPSHPRSPAST